MSTHRETAETLLRKIDTLRDMPPPVASQCATAHALLALIDALCPPAPPPAPPPDTTWIEGGQ